MTHREMERLTWSCHSTQRIDCPLCGSAEQRPVVEEHGLTIVRCARCGLVFTNPQPTADELDRFYAQYFPPESSPIWAKQMTEVFRREGRNPLLQRQRSGRLLDVGCGFGFFLDMMRHAGWDAAGVEPSRTAGGWARDKLGLDVTIGLLGDADFAAESFDAVTLWYVLEHVPNPHEVLAQCAALLKPGGMLIARVPNDNIRIDAILGKLGRSSFLINPPRHLFDYTRTTLSKLMARAGLSVVHAQNAIPRSTGTVKELVRRLGWYWMSELVRAFVGGRDLFGSSMTVYAEKEE